MNLFILPNTLPKKYLQDIKIACAKNRFKIQEVFDLNETEIIVSNLDRLDDILKILKLTSLSEISHAIYLVKLKWLTDSNKKGELCDFKSTDYLIGSNVISKETSEKSEQPRQDFIISSYECQRATPLLHLNHHLTDGLEVLEEYAEFKATDHQALRALAFRRAICVLKCLPFKIVDMKQLRNLKNIGEHTTSIIEEILLNGFSKEVERIKSDEFYKAMKNLSAIYGCGIAISNRLFSLGYTNIESIRTHHDSISHKFQSDIERIKYGITFYEDLTVNKITQDESNYILDYMKQLIKNEIDSTCLVELMGGFRRGKPCGHDIDILVVHPKLGDEKFVLTKLIDLLENKGLVIYGKHNRKSEHDWTKSDGHRDLFETYICILKLPKFETTSKRLKTQANETYENNLSIILSSLDASQFNRNWIARRCDFIICPIDQYAFGVLGWTGSRQFNRSIRLYADRESNYKLSSHGLFDKNTNRFLGAKTEEEIFQLLKLDFLLPEFRNC